MCSYTGVYPSLPLIGAGSWSNLCSRFLCLLDLLLDPWLYMLSLSKGTAVDSFCAVTVCASGATEVFGDGWIWRHSGLGDY